MPETTASTPSDWDSPLLPEEGERIYNAKGVMLARDLSEWFYADGEPRF